MRVSILAALIVAAGATSVAAQDSQKPSKPNDLVTMSGCIAAGEKKGFLLNDDLKDSYSLTGMNVKEFVGKRVEVTGSSPSPKRVRIVGGLYPSPNVAGQAGDIDPTKAAIASQSGPASNMPRPPIEFRVREVRVLPGACPQS